jgi:hypothetical protein
LTIIYWYAKIEKEPRTGIENNKTKGVERNPMNECLEKDFASIGVIFRDAGAGKIELLTINCSDPRGFSKIKFPTETREPNESPWTTLVNGLNRELGVDPERPMIQVEPFNQTGDGEPKPILTISLEGDPGKPPIHEKHVFLVSIVRGGDAFRKTNRIEPDGDVLSPPVFTEARELMRLMQERGLLHHQCALFKALECLAVKRPVCDEYQDFLGDSSFDTFKQDEEAISAEFRRIQAEKRLRRQERSEQRLSRHR